MRRTIATLGVVGLGVLGATVSAHAAPPEKISICHATGSVANPYKFETINLNALSAHVGDTGDIVPANDGTDMPNGQNLSTANTALLANNCVAVEVVVPPTNPPTDPPTTPPTDPPTTPPATPGTNSPAVETVVVPPASVPATVATATVAPAAAAPAAVTPVAAAAPQAAAAAVPAAAVTNVGYNVQTAAGKSDAGIPQWLGALTGLFTGVAALVLWRGARGKNANG
ncbi:hypothetical protein [Arthrobacter sp. 92]|uniref:hypothetical protein n=1 Tax=Arthrobacter sp. 92 TaxID=3418175 RepID=UPI003D01427D